MGSWPDCLWHQGTLSFFCHRRTGFLIPCKCTPCYKLSRITESCHNLLNPVRATIKTSVHVSGASSDLSAIRTLSGTVLLLLLTNPLTWPVYKHSGDQSDFVKHHFSPLSLVLSACKPVLLLASWASHLQQFRVVTLFSFSGISVNLRYSLSAAP